MIFLGGIGMIMEGSWLYGLFNTCYGSNVVNHMFSGKAFSGALRAHILEDLALCFKWVEKSCNGDDIIQLEILYQSINEKSNSHESIDDNATIKKIKSLFTNSIQSLEKTSRTAKLWIQHHHLIEIVKGFIHAERLSDWVLHLQMVVI